MQIRITVPDEVVKLAAKAGLGAEDYVEQLLGRIAASRPSPEQPSPELAQAILREELRADWDHYQQTGLHLSNEEVDKWLEELTANPSAEPPALHR